MMTWRSAPLATLPTARVISAIARPVSSELAATCSEATLTPRALSVTWPISAPRLARVVS